MPSITDIKQKIKSLGSGDFQTLCDVILGKLYPDDNIVNLGMEPGTAKTTIGNPDTYFRIENGTQAGKYILAAYTTQDRDIYKKIKDDIEKCLDVKKTGLNKSDIALIVVCHVSG